MVGQVQNAYWLLRETGDAPDVTAPSVPTNLGIQYGVGDTTPPSVPTGLGIEFTGAEDSFGFLSFGGEELTFEGESLFY